MLSHPLNLNIQGMKKRCKQKKCPDTGRYLKNNSSAKSQLNQAISDASWYSLRQKTKHQAAKLGNWVIEVESRSSSQECHHDFAEGYCNHNDSLVVGEFRTSNYRFTK